MPRSLGVLAVTAIAPISWGTTYAVTSELLPDNRPLLAGVMRALPAGLVLVAATGARPHGVWWWRSAVLGALYIGIFLPLLFVSAYRLPGGVAATLGSIGPLVTLGIAAKMLGERPTVRKVMAGLAGVGGVALVVLRADARLDASGVLAGAAATVSMATANVLAKRWGRPVGVSALTHVGWQLTAGGLLIVPGAVLIEGLPPSLTSTNLAGYGFMAVVSTGLAYWLWFRGLTHLPANSIAFLALMSPLTAAVIGWVVLGQRLSPLQLAGMAIAVGSALTGAMQLSSERTSPPVTDTRNHRLLAVTSRRRIQQPASHPDPDRATTVGIRQDWSGGSPTSRPSTGGGPAGSVRRGARR